MSPEIYKPAHVLASPTSTAHVNEVPSCSRINQCFALALLASTVPANPVLGAQFDRPYVAFLEDSTIRYSRGDAKSLRSSTEQERQREIERCRKNESELRQQLDAARRGLKDLNRPSPPDNSDIA